jgi:hypothetical protein
MKTASGRGPLVCLLQQPLYGGPLAAAACCWWGQHADTCCVEHIFSWARRDPTHHTHDTTSAVKYFGPGNPAGVRPCN